MIHFSSKYRSHQQELMDDFEFQGAEMQALLGDLRRINKWLGGNHTTLNGVRKLMSKREAQDEFTILDLGCGDGEMLRVCAESLKAKGIRFKFIGLDANRHIIEEARRRSEAYPGIEFITMDVFSEEFETVECDIAICSLFLHHFTDEQVEVLLKKLYARTKVGVVINDLERSRIAFVLFKIVSTLFVRTKTARNDGLISIARAFKIKELEAFSRQLHAKHHLAWKWAFRYQWIIEKI
ncbi:MAG: methyltransferase domain-containing protein [Flavobacterium sp.]|nr:MAG: methyltransferase domain-containing protein [Flavobacterium sp.]